LKFYRGIRADGNVTVTVACSGLAAMPLAPRLDLANHSPTGFEWGYPGSGPAQLALAILADCVGDELALRHYQDFKRLIVSGLPPAQWMLTEADVRAALATLQNEGKAQAGPEAKFALGDINATPGILATLAHEEIIAALGRHVRGDWGDVDADDHAANERALREGTRLFSVYHSKNRTKFWIITEWDRSMTTVLLPREY